MDKKKDCTIPEYGDLPDLRAERMAVGAKQLKKAVIAGRAQAVFLARNADPALIAPIETLCLQHSVPITWVPDMGKLGLACGIEVGAAAAAVLR